VPRLTQQLKIVQALCEVLYAARITELRGIGREEFEVDAVVGAGARADAPVVRRRGEAAPASLNVVSASAGTVPEGQLFGSWHFVLLLSAKNAALINVLNGLARCPSFAVVTHVDVTGESALFRRSGEAPPPARRAPAASGTQPGEALKETASVLSRDERVVCGHDTPLTVRMELDVYQFAKPRAAGAGKAEEAK
jgi:hypothetical protein